MTRPLSGTTRTTVVVALLSTLAWPSNPAEAQLDPADFPPPAIRLTADPAASGRPRVSIDSEGNAIVVWQDARYGNHEILWRKFSLLGEPLSGMVRVTQNATNSVWPDVSCDDERSHVVWQEGSDIDNGQVFLERRDTHGLPPRPPVATVTFAKHPRVAASTGGDADVVFYRRMSVDQDVYYRRYHLDNTYNCERRFNAGSIPDYQKDPVVAVDGSAKATLLWYDMGSFFDDQLRQATVSFTCATTSNAWSVNTPRPAIDIAGSRVERVYQSGGQIRRLTSTNSSCVISASPGSASFASVATSATTSYAVWQDTRNGNNDIYLCQYTDCVKNSPDLPLILSAGSSELPDIAVNDVNGEWVAVWQENVSGNTEIFMTSSRLISDPPEFTLAGATFDKPLYLNGDIASVSVVTQSFAPAAADLELRAYVITNVGERFDIGTDLFTLGAGASRVSGFAWTVPDRDYGTDLGLALELRRGADLVASAVVPQGASTTPMTQGEIDQKIAELTTSECAPPITPCQMYLLGMVPGFGPAVAFVAFKAAVCEMGRQARLGNEAGVAVNGLKATLPAIRQALKGIGGPMTMGKLLLRHAKGIWDCSSDVGSGAFGVPGAPRAEGAQVAQDAAVSIDSLAILVDSSYVVQGEPYTNEFLLQGNVEMRIGVGGHWTSRDSVALTEVFLYPLLGAETRWSHVGPQPVRVGGSDTNPLSAIQVELRASAADSIDFGFLHRVGSNPPAWIRYPRFQMLAGSVGRLSVSDTTADFRLMLDQNGDGDPDQVVLPFPAGTILGAPTPPGSGIGAVRLLVGPNPVMGTATVRFELPKAAAIDLAIFDSSGRRIATLARGTHAAGAHRCAWIVRSGRVAIDSGVYFVRLATPWGGRASKLVVL